MSAPAKNRTETILWLHALDAPNSLRLEMHEMGSRSSSSSSSSTRRLQAVELVSIHEILLRSGCTRSGESRLREVHRKFQVIGHFRQRLAGLGGSDVGDDERFRSSIIAPPPPPGAASGVNESLCLRLSITQLSRSSGTHTVSLVTELIIYIVGGGGWLAPVRGGRAGAVPPRSRRSLKPYTAATEVWCKAAQI